ncbi:hypothetical protein J6590_067698 [Homalodisca vitripennis]|nr:hypothetical protein J6590_067698 [Homalodisca vitripennis]
MAYDNLRTSEVDRELDSSDSSIPFDDDSDADPTYNPISQPLTADQNYKQSRKSLDWFFSWPTRPRPRAQNFRGRINFKVHKRKKFRRRVVLALGGAGGQGQLGPGPDYKQLTKQPLGRRGDYLAESADTEMSLTIILANEFHAVTSPVMSLNGTVQFTFLLIKHLKSDSVLDLTPGIWSYLRLKEKKRSATKTLQPSSLHCVDIRDA